MSITLKKSARCCKCGNEDEITVFRSINVSENPELKEKVKDGSLFVWQCPDCGTVNLARYETLYHDPAERLMIWLKPEGDISESEMQAITNHTRAMGGYTLRRVGDIGSLMEKVLIREAGLDDVAVEMCKWVTAAEMGVDVPIHFYRIGGEGDERFITLTFPKNGNMASCNIGFNVYEDCVGIIGRNDFIVPEEGFARVDQQWLSGILR